MEDLAELQVANGIRSLRLDGYQLSADVAAVIQEAEVERTIEGASTFTLQLFDSKNVLLASGLLSERLTAQIGSLSFELVQVRKDGPNLTLTFEDLVIAALRRHDLPIKVAAGTTTHVDFAERLVKEEPWIGFITDKSLAETNKVELARGTPEKDEEEEGEEGETAPEAADAGPNMGTASEPRHARAGTMSASEISAVAFAAGFRGDALHIAVAVAMAESGGNPGARGDVNLTTGGEVSIGLWQINWRPAYSSDPTRNREANLDPTKAAQNAFVISKRGTSFQPWTMYTNGGYRKHLAAARSASSETAAPRPSGSGGSSWLKVRPRGSGWARGPRPPKADPKVDPVTDSPMMSQTEKAQKKAEEKREDTWACIGRLADERGWRRWSRDGSVVYMPDALLIKSPPSYVIREDSRLGVDSVNFDYDIGKPFATMTVSARIAEWGAPIGSTAEVEDLGPVDGRWIVASIRRSLFSISATITLEQPLPILPEPEDPETNEDEEPDGTEGSSAPVGAGAGAPGAPGQPGGNPQRRASSSWLKIRPKTTIGGTSDKGFAWPLRGAIISKFGPRNGRLHAGIDITVPVGTNIGAARGGVVDFAGEQSGYGNVVYVNHDGTFTRYAHMSAIECRKGQTVSTGDSLGKSGGAAGARGSGNSSGPHLHFEIRPGNNPEDPEKFLP